MWTQCCSATLIAALLLGGQPFSSAADEPTAESTPFAVKLALRADRTQFRPGEFVNLQGQVANVGNSDSKLPSVDFARQFAFIRLHVTAPGGEEFLYDPYANNPLRSSLTAISPRSFSTKLAAGGTYDLFQKGLRLTDGLSRWTSREHPTGPMSLRPAGEYQVWFEYAVPPVAGSPSDAWTGKATSNTLSLIVTQFKPNEHTAGPTAEQLQAIDKLEHSAPTAIDGRDLLQQGMTRAENEPLASRLVDLCLRDDRRANDFIAMIANRACNLDPEEGMNGALQLGIDGPYLKTAAMAALDAFDNPPHDPNHLRVFRSGYGINITIAYLRFHPDDAASRNRLVKLAKQSAPLPPPLMISRLKPAGDQKPETPLSTPLAWHVLLELEVLHPGMSVDEAVEILGQPSSRSDKGLNWYISTPRHVNPGLEAAIKEGKIVSFRRYSG